MAIRRPRLNRQVADIQAPISGERAPDWSFTIHCPYEGDLTFDFNQYRAHGRDNLAGHMRDALWSMQYERVGRSLLSYDAHGIGYFWRFLDDLHAAGEAITHLIQIDRHLLDQYLAWLELQISRRGPTKGQKLSLTAQRTSFNHLKALLRNRLKFSPSEISSDLTFPRNPFPHTNRRTPRRESYSSTEKRAIIKALHDDLSVIHGENHLRPMPDLQVLIVHMILLALATGWNRQSLIELRRDSMLDHPLPDRKLFIITKRRANATHSTSVQINPVPEDHKSLSTAPATIAEHFHFICEFTEPLVGQATPNDRDCVFLWRVPNGIRNNKVVRLNGTTISNALRDFCRRHGLRDDQGQPLRLNIARLRPTMATDLYQRTRDIRQVQRALGHSSPVTTARHYASKPFESERDHSLVLDSLVHQLTSFKIEDKTLVAADGKIPQTEVPNILSDGYSTGIARCRNPFRENDTVCNKYFACFRCPNLCVFEDDLWRLFSFYERLLSERIKINPTHWMKTYGPIVRRIDAEIAPLFPPDVVEAARRLAKDNPHPTWKAP